MYLIKHHTYWFMWNADSQNRYIIIMYSYMLLYSTIVHQISKHVQNWFIIDYIHTYNIYAHYIIHTAGYTYIIKKKISFVEILFIFSSVNVENKNTICLMPTLKF